MRGSVHETQIHLFGCEDVEVTYTVDSDGDVVEIDEVRIGDSENLVECLNNNSLTKIINEVQELYEERREDCRARYEQLRLDWNRGK